MKYKVAYGIKHLYKINKPLKLNELREKFFFNAPQGFAYADTYMNLVNHIENNIGYTKIF